MQSPDTIILSPLQIENADGVPCTVIANFGLMLQYKDNFEKLLKVLDEILEENKGINVRAIPWLHFIRYHPVFNSQYQILFSDKYKFLFFLIFLLHKGNNKYYFNFIKINIHKTFKQLFK